MSARGDLDPADRGLLNRVQAGVSLVERPWAALGQDVGLDEDDVLARLQRLAAAGVLRQIGGIFDTRACGYASALVAARVDPARLAAAAGIVGEHPGVTHAYERNHAWNFWFTLAVPPSSALGIQGTVRQLGVAAGVAAAHVLPVVRPFKIAARFDMEDGAGAAAAAAVPAGSAAPEPLLLDDGDVRAIRVLQRPLPLVPAPFAVLAAPAGLGEAELRARGAALLASGAMRRFAALLNHRRAGFSANVMVAWDVEPARLEAAGRHLATLAAVTHCYERARFPDWPYGLFSMVHGRAREECLEVVARAHAVIVPRDVAALWTVREFKKTRLMLFTPEYEAWERRARESAA